MNTLELKIKEINLILEEISSALEVINDDNFDLVIAELNQNLAKVTSIQKDLESRYDKPTLKSYQGDLNIFAKQIYERFDNIIKDIKNEQSSIQVELINIQNKKKLANYNR